MNQRTCALSLLVSGLYLVGCSSTDCGPGTVDRNGVCVAPSALLTNAGCGPGTQPDPGGSPACVPIARCGAPGSNTVLTDGGICQGVGAIAPSTDGGMCSAPLPCPPQAP